jgi:ActR/RegA family two-component response regulator
MKWQQAFSLLLAEEEEEAKAIIDGWAALRGWKVEQVRPTFEEISRSLAKATFEVLVLGLHSGPREGCVLLESLRNKVTSIPVVVLCPHVQDSGIVELVRHGAFDCLNKPLNEGNLSRTMSRIESDLEQSLISKSMYRFVHQEYTVFEFKSSELGNGFIPLEIVSRLYDAGYIDHSTKTRVVVAFQEALTNAHDHGNLELESSWKEEFDQSGVDKFSKIKAERLSDTRYGGRRLRIEISFLEFKLTVRIADEGKGCPKSIREAHYSPEELLLAGRGLSLMRWGFDDLSFNENGNEVTMVKHLEKIK